MSLSYETRDWLFDNALWLFIGMVVIVMAFGSWWLRKNIRKRSVSISIGRSLWFSFWGGITSIVLFYVLLLVYNFAINFICAFIGNLAGIDDFEISKTAFVAIYVPIYFILFQMLIRRMVMDYAKRNSPIPKYPITPSASIPQIQIENGKSKEFLKSELKWDSGWPLTVMCGLCTVVFYLCFTSQLRDKSMEAIFATNVNGLSKALSLYMDANDGKYPVDLGELVEGGYSSRKMFQTSTDDDSWADKPNEVYKAPKYFHFNRLPQHAPSDLLWLWADPEKYMSAKMPVGMFSGGIQIIKKKELPALIERSQKWLAEHPPATFGK